MSPSAGRLAMVIPCRAVVTKEDWRQSGISSSSARCSLTFPSVCCHRRRSLDADGFPCALPSGPARVVWKSGMFTRAPNLTWMDTSCGIGSHPFHGLRYLHRFSFSALEHLALDFFTTPGNTDTEVSVPLSLPTLHVPMHLHLPSLTTLSLPIFSGPRLPHLCLRSTRLFRTVRLRSHNASYPDDRACGY